MHNSTAAAALITFLALGACQQGPMSSQASCSGEPVVQARGAIYMSNGTTATAADAGALFAVVTHEHTGCNDVIITVTDSAAPARTDVPWADGHAYMLSPGTPLYERVGAEPGTQLVAERSPGEWVGLVFQHRVGS